MFDTDVTSRFDKTDPFSGMYQGVYKTLPQDKYRAEVPAKQGIGNYDILAKGMKTYRMPESKTGILGLYRRDEQPIHLGEYHVLDQAYSARIRDDAYSAQMRKAEFTRKYNIQSH